ncbi:hypothetical protein FRB90_010458 [Tulasnella sp. 427]|nr:hypothetical protein FRB90_010458 [Tulasnella sp. 427]
MAPRRTRNPGEKNDCSDGAITFRSIHIRKRGRQTYVRISWDYCPSSPDYFAFGVVYKPENKFKIIASKISTRGAKHWEGILEGGFNFAGGNTKVLLFQLLNINDYSDVYDDEERKVSQADR